MQIFIDADACPVVDITVRLCKKYNKKCTIVCDYAHNITKDGAKTIIVSKGADSADFKIANLINAGDIVITQDYGLAAMCMAKSAKIINQDGLLYTKDNIDGLLFYRSEARKMRAAGKKCTLLRAMHERLLSYISNDSYYPYFLPTSISPLIISSSCSAINASLLP